MSSEDKLRELGLTLPTVPTPIGNYVPFKRDGHVIYLSGQGPRKPDGRPASRQSRPRRYRRAGL